MVQAGLLKARAQKGAGLVKSISRARAGPGRKEGPKHPQQVEREEREQCPEKGLGRDLCHNLKGGKGTRGTCADSGVVSLPESAWDSSLP